MIPLFQQGAFTAGPNETPETIAQKRAFIAAMMPRFGSAKYVGEGLGQLATGVVIGRQNRKLNEAEGAGRKSAAEMFGRLFGTANSAQSPAVQGPLSVLGMTPSEPAPASPADALGNDAMAALGKPAMHDHAAAHPGQTHAEWLRYSNQNATRNDPLDPTLIDAMSFLPGMGITMNVISGGQEPAGTPGGTRTGSTRHDHGKAADVDFYKDGRKLDWNNPADLPILQEIVRTAKSRGITGIGAGDDYMGAGRFHIGFGAPAVWGAGGSSANAPQWLVEAYNGAPSGSAPVSSGAAPAPTSAPAIPINELYMALQNPWMSAEEKGLITSMIQEQQQASDPLRQLELQKAQLELEQMQNPTQQAPEAFTERMFTLNALGIDPQSEEGRAYIMTGKLPEPPKEAARPMTAEERAAWGIPETDTTPYKMTDNGPVAIGGGGTTITNVMDGGGKFEEAFAKGDAATVETVYNAGLQAQRNLGRIDQLGALLEANPTGAGAAITQFAGSLGIQTEGLDEIQAAQALINSLVPEQRQPGSGPMSDADLALFKQSLPQIINSPGGNKIIVDTMRSIAQYDAEGARIVQRLRNGELTRAEAFDALQNRKNPLADFKPAAKSEGAAPAASGAASAAPEGIEQDVWDAMTPEERALWD